MAISNPVWMREALKIAQAVRAADRTASREIIIGAIHRQVMEAPRDARRLSFKITEWQSSGELAPPAAPPRKQV